MRSSSSMCGDISSLAPVPVLAQQRRLALVSLTAGPWEPHWYPVADLAEEDIRVLR